jgi:hypothetical protein
MSKNVTYEQLKTVMRERAGTDGFPSVASLSNALSALNGFLGESAIRHATLASAGESIGP